MSNKNKGSKVVAIATDATEIVSQGAPIIAEVVSPWEGFDPLNNPRLSAGQCEALRQAAIARGIADTDSKGKKKPGSDYALAWKVVNGIVLTLKLSPAKKKEIVETYGWMFGMEQSKIVPKVETPVETKTEAAPIA